MFAKVLVLFAAVAATQASGLIGAGYGLGAGYGYGAGYRLVGAPGLVGTAVVPAVSSSKTAINHIA
ncbi:hypothetical protein X975_19721, partial [Stegodyphus mimosarum]